MSCPDEKTLLQRLLADDASAWREVVEKYTGLLLAISRRTFGVYGFEASMADCEDAVADVWGNLLRHEGRLIRQCMERGQLLPMLHVLTRNRTIDLMRRRKLMTQPLDEELTELPAEEQPAENAEIIARIPAALTVLAPKERTLVELFFLQGKKYREIELLTGIPQNSVGPTLNRALAKLRVALQGPIASCRATVPAGSNLVP